MGQGWAEGHGYRSGQATGVVLMDLETPLVAGQQSTRTSRMCDFSAPIIAVTAHKSDGEKKRALGAGCNNVLEKPMARAAH